MAEVVGEHEGGTGPGGGEVAAESRGDIGVVFIVNDEKRSVHPRCQRGAAKD